MKKKSIEELERLSIEKFRQTKKIPLVIVLDNIRSLHNVGSVFRTSDAYRIEKIILCGITSTPPSSEIHKTALGAEDAVEWEYFNETLDAVLALKNIGYELYAIEQVADSLSLEKLQLDEKKKYAIVLGNEVKGVQQVVVDSCIAAIELPQFGTKHSLNVSVTAGIVIWEFFKQLY